MSIIKASINKFVRGTFFLSNQAIQLPPSNIQNDSTDYLKNLKILSKTSIAIKIQ
jgi:hypothetical protein